MTSVPLVRLDDVSKRFVIRKDKSLKERVVNLRRSNAHKEDFWAVRNVSLEIEAGSTVGLIGPNGSGKSTLLKLIGGIIQPTSGSISRRGRLAALLELGAGFHPDLTGRENVFLNSSILGISQAETERLFDDIVAFSGIEKFIDTQVKFYSSGMYVRLAFAVAIHVDPDVLLVDEVLAVGDEPFQRKCMERIRRFQHEGRTIVLVTHALDQVAELCDRAIVLESGHVMHDGEPRDGLRLLRDDFEAMVQGDRERAREQAEREQATLAEPSRARISAITVRDSNGNPLDSTTPGQALTIEIDIDAQAELTDWIVGISIETSLGQLVYGTNTKLLDLPLPPVAGTSRIGVTLPELWLGEGHYQIQAAIADSTQTELDRMLCPTGLAVRADGRSIGPLFATAPTINIPGLTPSPGGAPATG